MPRINIDQNFNNDFLYHANDPRGPMWGGQVGIKNISLSTVNTTQEMVNQVKKFPINFLHTTYPTYDGLIEAFLDPKKQGSILFQKNNKEIRTEKLIRLSRIGCSIPRSQFPCTAMKHLVLRKQRFFTRDDGGLIDGARWIGNLPISKNPSDINPLSHSKFLVSCKMRAGVLRPAVVSLGSANASNTASRSFELWLRIEDADVALAFLEYWTFLYSYSEQLSLKLRPGIHVEYCYDPKIQKKKPPTCLECEGPVYTYPLAPEGDEHQSMFRCPKCDVIFTLEEEGVKNG